MKNYFLLCSLCVMLFVLTVGAVPTGGNDRGNREADEPIQYEETQKAEPLGEPMDENQNDPILPEDKDSPASKINDKKDVPEEDYVHHDQQPSHFEEARDQPNDDRHDYQENQAEHESESFDRQDQEQYIPEPNEGHVENEQQYNQDDNDYNQNQGDNFNEKLDDRIPENVPQNANAEFEDEWSRGTEEIHQQAVPEDNYQNRQETFEDPPPRNLDEQQDRNWEGEQEYVPPEVQGEQNNPDQLVQEEYTPEPVNVNDQRDFDDRRYESENSANDDQYYDDNTRQQEQQEYNESPNTQDRVDREYDNEQRYEDYNDNIQNQEPVYEDDFKEDINKDFEDNTKQGVAEEDYGTVQVEEARNYEEEQRDQYEIHEEAVHVENEPQPKEENYQIYEDDRYTEPVKEEQEQQAEEVVFEYKETIADKEVRLEDIPPPNMVIFLASNVGMNDLGCYGNKSAKTPNLDYLASRGVRLSHHVTSGYTDTSSRAAFLTGRNPIRYGLAPVGSDEIETLASKVGLPTEEDTFADILQSENYDTAFIGTWNLGLCCDSLDDHCHHPNSHGFATFYGPPLVNRHTNPDTTPQNELMKKPLVILAIAILVCMVLRKILGSVATLGILISVSAFGGWSYFCYKHPHIWSNSLMRNGDITEQPVNWERLTERIVSNGKKFLSKDNSPKPKLLVVSLPQFHPHLETSSKFRGEKAVSSRRDKVEELDWAVGELLNYIQFLGKDETTLVYFTSTYHRAAPDFEVLKQQLVPGLAMWPRIIPEGIVATAVTSQMDMLPTLVHFAKGSLQKQRVYDGSNIANVLMNKENDGEQSRTIAQYCGEDIWSIIHVKGGGAKAYIGYYFQAEWNSDPLYCVSTLSNRPLGTQNQPESIYVIYRESTIMSPLSPLDFEYSEALDLIRRSRQKHISGVEEGESQFTWYKQSWHAYLQPYCADGQSECVDTSD